MELYNPTEAISETVVKLIYLRRLTMDPQLNLALRRIVVRGNPGYRAKLSLGEENSEMS